VWCIGGDVQSGVEHTDTAAAAADHHSSGWTGSGDAGGGVDSSSHQRLPPSVPQLQHLVTSLQLQLKQSHATQVRTR